MTGTIINVVTVAIGSGLGILLKQRLPEKYKSIILQGIGLITILIGLQMALKTSNMLIALSSLLLGGIIGQYFLIDQKLDRFAEVVKKRFSNEGDQLFSEGFITASLIFCVGPMTVIGAINDGLQGDFELLAIKSVLDGFTSIALAASFGLGVMFSIFTILIIQGGISMSASLIERVLNETMVNEMTAVGGLIILGIGLLILDIKKINVANFLPALIIAPLVIKVLQWLKII